MKFKSIFIKEGMFSKTFSFSDKLNLVYSEFNSAGKTTLLRIMLYALGYNIPSTRKMKFSNCEIKLIVISEAGTELEIERFKNELTVAYSTNVVRYVLPYEHEQFLQLLFGVSNRDVLFNLLGTFYIDQEKGWTLLNKGYVIGHIYFDLRSLVRGLINKNCEDMEESVAAIESELKKYKEMQSLAEYQKQIHALKGKIITSENAAAEDQLATLQFDRNQLNEEYNQLNRLIAEQASFVKYIEKMHLVIETSWGDVAVNRDNIKGFRDINSFAITRKALLLSELKKIEKKIADLEASIHKENRLDDIKTMIQIFDERVVNIPLNEIAINNVINDLQIKKKALKSQIEEATMSDIDFINSFYQYAYGYLCEFGIEEYADEAASYLFTDDLKSLSGAILQLTVFSFKLAYVAVVKKVTGICLPLIIDSPRGRELDSNNIQKIIAVLKRDYVKHQIIIASIYKDLDADNIIPLQDSLLGINIES